MTTDRTPPRHPRLYRRLLRLWCRAVGCRPVKVALGWCPRRFPGDLCLVYATCCGRCRLEMDVPRECGLNGGRECE